MGLVSDEQIKNFEKEAYEMGTLSISVPLIEQGKHRLSSPGRLTYYNQNANVESPLRRELMLLGTPTLKTSLRTSPAGPSLLKLLATVPSSNTCFVICGVVTVRFLRSQLLQASSFSHKRTLTHEGDFECSNDTIAGKFHLLSFYGIKKVIVRLPLRTNLTPTR